MRWLALAALGACSFSPGGLSSGDARISGDDVRGDVPGDTEVVPDAPDATPPSPARVRLIEIADNKVFGGPHASFPVLVSLTTPWLKSVGNAGDVARADGFDIRFSVDQAGATPLSHDVEVYDPVAGTLVAFVKVSSLTAQTVIYLHYGDPANTTNPEQVANVWSGGYELVVHMDGSGDATGKSTPGAPVSVGNVAGRIGPAGSFDGATSSMLIGNDVEVDNIFTGGGTVDAWFFANAFGQAARGRIFDKGQWALFVDNQNVSGGFSFTHESSSLGAWSGPTSSVTTAAWHHIAVTYDKSSAANDPTALIDGTVVTMTEQFAPSGTMTDDDIFNLVVGNTVGGGRTFNGNLDELRLSSTPRGTGWIQTQYQNQSDPGSFYTVSAPL